MNQIRYSKI